MFLRAPAQQIDQLPLPLVGVLKFVHHDMLKARLHAAPHLRMLRQQAHRQRFQVVKGQTTLCQAAVG